MSRPYQYPEEQERITSPLDRRPQNSFPSGQPPSFKTNVNRAKTKKWVEAKSYSYEGDDWGDYDEDDEYGVEAATSQPPAPQQRQPPTRAGGNFTSSGGGQAGQVPHRQPSFDAGDERRTFSAGSSVAPQHVSDQPTAPLHVDTALPNTALPDPTTSGSRQFSAGSFAHSNFSDLSSLDPRNRSSYSPSAEPQPLHTQIPISSGPSTATPTVAPIAPRFEQVPASPVRPPSSGSTGSGTRVIRPAEIYKRVAEEREKERRSLEQQRSTPDSTARRSSTESSGRAAPALVAPEPTGADSMSSGRQAQLRPSLAPLPERKSEYNGFSHNGGPTSAAPPVQSLVSPVIQRAGTNPPQLPQVGGEPTFGDEFWESTLGGTTDAAAENPPSVIASNPPPAAVASTAANESLDPLQHQNSVGFRSIVHQAFDQPVKKSSEGISKQDSTRSFTDSSVSRSDTTGTSDISPIMSRVPSSATAAAKSRAADTREKTPAIQEEPSDTYLTRSRPVSGEVLSLAHQVPRKPSPNLPQSHTDSAEFIPGYRRDLNTPSPNNSPARSPLVEANKQLPRPEMADLAVNSPLNQSGTKLLRQPFASDTRETDIAEVAGTAPAEPVQARGAAEKLAQDSYPEHKPTLPAERSTTIKREESPSKGRVADLAGRFNDTSDSRRGSDDSWEASSSRSSLRNAAGVSENAGSVQSIKPTGSDLPPDQLLHRPPAEREASFRPKLPGQWESFATTTSDVSQREQVNNFHRGADTDKSQSPHTDNELTPTSVKRPAGSSDLMESQEQPGAASAALASLAAAGAAMGEAIKKSVGLDTTDDTPKAPRRAFGDLTPRPIAPERMESSVSSVPPTPPAKDDWTNDKSDGDLPPLVPPKESGKGAVMSSTIAQSYQPFITRTRTEDSAEELESDRLRKEIVHVLSPVEPSSSSQQDAPGSHHRTPEENSKAITHHESSLLPQEHDNYWNEKEVAPVESLATVLPEVAVDLSQTSHVTGHASTAPAASLEHSRAHTESPPVALAGPSTVLPQQLSWEPNHLAIASASTPQATSSVQGSGPAVEGYSSPGSKEPVEDNPRYGGEGLHVINAASGDVPEPPLIENPPSPEGNEPSIPQPVTPTQSRAVAAPSSRELGADPGLPAFRDIVADKSQHQRISKFNATRQSWVEHDMGVQTWLNHVLQTQPEHRNIVSEPLTAPLPGSSPRHKTASSISRVFTGSKNIPPPQAGGVEPASAAPSNASTPSQPHKASGVQGKDLLQVAGVLGGKGVKGAKGLFAKGKSKFRGSAGHEKALPPSPSNSGSDVNALARNTFAEDAFSEKTRPSVRAAKRSSRSFSPFRRSRPSSVVVPNAAQSVPGVPTEPLPEIADRGRSLSATSNSSVFYQSSIRGSEHGQQPTAWTQQPGIQRPLTPPSALPRLGVLPSPATDDLGRPTRAHTIATVRAATQHERMQSVIRETPSLQTSEEEKQPTKASMADHVQVAQIGPGLRDGFRDVEAGRNATAPHSTIGKGGAFLKSELDDRRRIVSMIQPEEETEGAKERVELNEPVSPIEPEDGLDDRKDGVTAVPDISRTASKASQKSIGGTATPSMNNTTVSGAESLQRGRSKSSMDSWEHDEHSSNTPSHPHPTPHSATGVTSDGQQLHRRVSLNHDIEPKKAAEGSVNIGDEESAGASAGGDDDRGSRPVTASSKQYSSAAEEEAGVGRVVSLSKSGSMIPAQPLSPSVTIQQPGLAKRVETSSIDVRNLGAPESETAQALNGHTNQQEADHVSSRYDDGQPPDDTKDTSRNTMTNPPDIPISTAMADTASFTSSKGPDTSSYGDERAPTPPQKPAMTITSPEHPLRLASEQQQSSEREPSSAGGLGARSLPSVSSISNKGAPSSIEPSSDSANEQAYGQPGVSPTMEAFQHRVYTPPNSGLERPMSFVPLPRDPLGKPPQEQINTGRQGLETHPTTPPRQWQPPNSIQRSPPRIQGQIGVISKPPPVPPPWQPPPQLRSDGSPQQRVGGAYAPNAPGRFIGTQSLEGEIVDPRLQSAKHQPRGIGLPSIDQPGAKRLSNEFWSNGQEQQQTPLDRSRINPQLVVPPQAIRQQSFQSVDSQGSYKDDKKKRSSGLLAAFKRPISAGAESSLSSLSKDAASTMAQASESPTRQEYLQSPTASVGAIPPTENDVPPVPPKKDKEKDTKGKEKQSKLQRASTTQVAEPSKKKRFSGLGSIFGRSGTTGHASSKKAGDGRPRLTQEKQQHHGTVFHRVPENPSASAFAAMQQYQAQHPQQGQLRSQQGISSQSPVSPPPGGYYAPGSEPQQQAARQALGQFQSRSPNSFQHGHGAAGYAAMAQQQTGQFTDRSESATTSQRPPFHFDRPGSISSDVLSRPLPASPPVSNEHHRGSFDGGSNSPISPQRGSSPYVPQQRRQGFRRTSRNPRMTSIGEQHQERPWQVSLPDGRDDDDPEHMAREIMRAASARWHRDSEGQPLNPNLVQHQSPSSPHGQEAHGGPTPTSPTRQQQVYASPTTTSPHPQQQHYPPPQVVQPPKPSQAVQYQNQPLPPQQYQHYYPPPQAALYRQASDSHPQIPPLFQGRIPIVQPQPQQAGAYVQGYPAPPSQSDIGVAISHSQPASADAYAQQRRTEDWQQGYRNDPPNPGSVAPPVPSKIGVQLPGGRIGVALPGLARQESERKERSREEAEAAAAAAAAAAATNGAAAQNSQPQSPAVENAESASPVTAKSEEKQTASSSQNDEERPPLAVVPPPNMAETQPVDEGAGTNSTATSSAETGTGAGTAASHARHPSDNSDFVPVMKGASYPGDEWVPTWDGE